MTEPLHAASKVILLGEHAVVYGRPALAVGLCEGLRAVSLVPAARLRVVVPAWGLDVDEDGEGVLPEALRALRQHCAGLGAGFVLRVDARLPGAAGLGSSAALSVLAVRALAQVHGRVLSDEAVNDAAHAMERVFHGTPSGIDNTVATFGGVCLFGDPAALRGLAQTGERITARALRLGVPAPRLLIADSAVPRQTRRMVAQVRARLRRAQDDTLERFDRIEAAVRAGVAALEQGDLVALGAAMNHNQQELEGLGLSVEPIDRLLALARAAGSPGAKLTGGGGGGCVVALAGAEPEAILAAWTAAGFVSWDTASLVSESRAVAQPGACNVRGEVGQ